ncbi:uncharacterized protein DUF742 [Streptomyces sp. Amel2xB2]|uniref:DUF742 domain-containing protein n=1 Tax=Streptomyces nanshensis TaxID=518642 RepID=A0A1E7L3B9_9ACTN|nr:MULTISPECIES: DUF742 domain-containing protein [Streptomyces]OEV10675.1 hypothetical protein AN218_16390 [Streptomyces nanshensis]RAJ71324.1 uncharacterized protein DUF742 [Streptomyces sp. Amel2xB2]
MGTPHHPQWFDREAGFTTRPYAITRGRTLPSRSDLTLITQVVGNDAGSGHDTRREQPESAAIMELVRRRPLAIVEIASYLDLPASVVRVLCGDLADRSLILVKKPGPENDTPDEHARVLRKVIDGIRKL